MSNNLGRTEPTATGTQKVVLLNESDSIIEGALTDNQSFALDGDGSTALTVSTELFKYRACTLAYATGALAAPENVIVSTSIKKMTWWIDSTTGGQTVTVKTLSGTGIAISSTPKLLYCDGTNVIQIA